METQKQETVTEIWLSGEPQTLLALCQMASKDEVSLIRQILKILVEKEITEDGVADAGRNLEEVFLDSGVDIFELVDALPILKTLPSWNNAAKLLKELVIKAAIDDCPLCGCETETYEDGAYGKTWTVRTCSNCDFKEDNEPDLGYDADDDER